MSIKMVETFTSSLRCDGVYKFLILQDNVEEPDCKMVLFVNGFIQLKD